MKTFEEQLRLCAEHLLQNEKTLRDRGEPTAAMCARAIGDLTKATLEHQNGHGDNSRVNTLLSLSDMHTLRYGTGPGESIIWAGYRRAGLDRECEEWKKLTNELRRIRPALIES